MTGFSKKDQLSRKCMVEGCDNRGNFKKKVCPECEKLIYSKRRAPSNRKSSIKPKGKTARQKAKDQIQRYARARDANEYGRLKCITCPRNITWNKNCDGGHCRPAHLEATCFDERNINGQCKTCNRQKMQTQEAIEVYAKAVDEKWGPGTYEDLFTKSLIEMHRNDLEYIAIEKYYREKADELIKQKGI